MPVSKKVKIKEAVTPIDGAPVEESSPTEGQLTVDVFENEASFVVMSPIAGVASKDIEIQIDKDMLLIKGCRPNPELSSNKNYFYQECHWGTFARKVVLPENVDASQAQADYDKGVLVVKFPKVTANDTKELPVKEN